MKGILIIIILISFLSCNDIKPSPNDLHTGDIIYLKPDSTKAVIYGIFADHTYGIEYVDSLKIRHSQLIYKSEIYHQ